MSGEAIEGRHCPLRLGWHRWGTFGVEHLRESILNQFFDKETLKVTCKTRVFQSHMVAEFFAVFFSFKGIKEQVHAIHERSFERSFRGLDGSRGGGVIGLGSRDIGFGGRDIGLEIELGRQCALNPFLSKRLLIVRLLSTRDAS